MAELTWPLSSATLAFDMLDFVGKKQKEGAVAASASLVHTRVWGGPQPRARGNKEWSL